MKRFSALPVLVVLVIVLLALVVPVAAQEPSGDDCVSIIFEDGHEFVAPCDGSGPVDDGSWFDPSPEDTVYGTINDDEPEAAEPENSGDVMEVIQPVTPAQPESPAPAESKPVVALVPRGAGHFHLVGFLRLLLIW